MIQTIPIDSETIFSYIKLSFQIPEIIEKIIINQIIESKATDLGIKVEATDLQRAVDSFRLATQLHSAEQTKLWLQKYFLSLDDFQKSIYLNIISKKLSEHLFADRVESFFYEHQLDYATVVMYEIVLDNEDLAMELFYELQEGEISFQNIARQYVKDVTLRRSGGYKGMLCRSQLQPEISAAVFSANPPQIIEPIMTSKGFHLIVVEEIIQPTLDEPLKNKIMNDLFSSWLKQQIQQVKLDLNINLDELI
jgi:parvulin-like peptidyl-prolyl isomerase